MAPFTSAKQCAGLCLVLAAAASAAGVPSILLGNDRGTAQPGLMMPAIGLGTGAYSDNPAVGYNGYPECWASAPGCGGFARRAVTTWIAQGGRRLDAANSYGDSADVGAAMAASGVPRADLFVLSKVGPSFPLGYNDTLSQFAAITAAMNTTYLDALLIHWPWPSASKGNVTQNATQSSDPFCNTTALDTYDEKECRLSTWRAMLEIYFAGGAKAIGVSNYNVSHFEEIRAAGLPLPAITQSPFNIYLSAAQMDIASYCWRNGIVFLGYSPFGVPDYKKFPTPSLPAASQLEDPVVLAIAAAHGATPAQVIIAWHWALGVPVNPRSMNAQHMADNIAAFGLTLSQSEIHLLSTRPQDMCSFDADWCDDWACGAAARLCLAAPHPLFFFAALAAPFPPGTSAQSKVFLRQNDFVEVEGRPSRRQRAAAAQRLQAPARGTFNDALN
jgi:diketogulonate reductase-like aldo/keto reductase